MDYIINESQNNIYRQFGDHVDIPLSLVSPNDGYHYDLIYFGGWTSGVNNFIVPNQTQTAIKLVAWSPGVTGYISRFSRFGMSPGYSSVSSDGTLVAAAWADSIGPNVWIDIYTGDQTVPGSWLLIHTFPFTPASGTYRQPYALISADKSAIAIITNVETFDPALDTAVVYDLTTFAPIASLDMTGLDNGDGKWQMGNGRVFVSKSHNMGMLSP